jgi:hypothetical protein
MHDAQHYKNLQRSPTDRRLYCPVAVRRYRNMSAVPTVRRPSLNRRRTYGDHKIQSATDLRQRKTCFSSSTLTRPATAAVQSGSWTRFCSEVVRGPSCSNARAQCLNVVTVVTAIAGQSPAALVRSSSTRRRPAAVTAHTRNHGNPSLW